MKKMQDALVVEALSWRGTPYIHQMARKGAGCDCLGLIRGLWRERFGSEPETPPAYTMDWAEPQGHEVLWEAALRHLIPKDIAPAEAGDVLLFRMRPGGIAKHLGIQSQITPIARFVHAYSGHGVVESPFTDAWQRRLVARFVFPDRPPPQFET